jgi:hypothetical protein
MSAKTHPPKAQENKLSWGENIRTYSILVWIELPDTVLDKEYRIKAYSSVSAQQMALIKAKGEFPNAELINLKQLSLL